MEYHYFLNLSFSIIYKLAHVHSYVKLPESMWQDLSGVLLEASSDMVSQPTVGLHIEQILVAQTQKYVDWGQNWV